MSLETALARANYRYLDNVLAQTMHHFHRSNRVGYWDRMGAVGEQMQALRPLCKFAA